MCTWEVCFPGDTGGHAVAQIPLGSAAVCGRHVPGSPHSELGLLNVPLFFQLFAIETTWLIVSSSCFLSQVSAKVLALTC